MEQDVIQLNINMVWITISAALVMLMQAGFTALESGMTRAKNSINVAMKNITDFVLSVLIFWFVGYGLMFGDDINGLFGNSGFMLIGLKEPEDYASFTFQATFAGTAATIVSGAIAERMRFISYAIVSIILTAVIYPVSGHWIWGDGGWLAEKSMVDFAGSTVVHSLGGWVGLAGALMLGPRIGRFNEDGKINKIHGHSLIIAVVGVLILWFGWFGFNGGSTLTGDRSIAIIIANTMLSAAAGGLSCFLICLLATGGEIHIEKLLNGIVAGLVGITAGCAVVEPTGAVLVGITSGAIVYVSEEIVLRIFRIDDPVNVIAAHGVAGAWGTLALCLFAPTENLPLKDTWDQFEVQLIGVLAVFGWGFGTGLVMFWILRSMNFLRVTPEAEKLGLNIHEHGASSSLADTMEAMQSIIVAYGKNDSTADLTRRIEIEVGTEAGDIAELFNKLLDNFQLTIKNIKQAIHEIDEASALMARSSDEMEQDVKLHDDYLITMATAIREMTQTIHEVAESTSKTAVEAQSTSGEVEVGESEIMQTIRRVGGAAKEIAHANEVITRLKKDSGDISTILDTINGIAEQTNLLALNAAIEAARAGDSGRGFAVVADEVRSLSRKTRDATEMIESMIDNLQQGAAQASEVIITSREKIETALTSVNLSGGALTKIREMVNNIELMSQSIAAATEEQSMMTTQISSNMNEIEETSQHSKNRATQAAKTSTILASLATTLKEMVGGLYVGEEMVKAESLLEEMKV